MIKIFEYKIICVILFFNLKWKTLIFFNEDRGHIKRLILKNMSMKWYLRKE